MVPYGSWELVDREDLWTTVGIDVALKALAVQARRDVVRELSARGEVCACEFAGLLGLAPSTVSHHMSVLVSAGLVQARKQGTWVHYRLNREALTEVVGMVAALADAGGHDAD